MPWCLDTPSPVLTPANEADESPGEVEEPGEKEVKRRKRMELAGAPYTDWAREHAGWRGAGSSGGVIAMTSAPSRRLTR